MRKNLIAAFLTLISLGSFAVLGSSPGFISSLLESMQKNPITRVFSFGSENRSGSSSEKNSRKIEVMDVLPTGTSNEQEVPEAILWSVIFSLPERLDSEAEKARLAGRDESLWSNYFVRQAKISAVSSQILRETATRYFAEVEPLDEQARLIINEMRDKNPQPPTLNSDGSFSSEPILPTELTSLQNQKDQAALRHRDNFRSGIGEEEFAKFSEFLVGEFAKGFVRHNRGPDEPAPPTYNENNGFTSFRRMNKGGNQ